MKRINMTTRFNGATSFQTWKLGISMTPSAGVASLQWGHVFSDVEIPDQRLRRLLLRVASMGPRLFRRGNDDNPSHKRRTYPASMGPRLFRRGNLQFFDTIFFRHEASMGPRLFRRGNLSNSKRRRKGSGCFNGSTSFQTWKCQDPPRKPERTRCFNGSTSFQTWKSDMLSSIALCCGGLQWGHVFSDVEISLPREAGSVKNLSHIY